jgi:tetratricopeptide (TPR) repeat protein
LKYGCIPILFALLASGGLGAQVGSTDFNSLTARAAEALRTNPSQAAVLYGEALRLKPDWAEGWFDLGASLFQSGQYSESRQALTKAAFLAPKNGAVFGFLGLCESKLGNRTAALGDLRKAEALGLPDDLRFVSAVRNEAADLCLHMRDFSCAVDQLRPLALAADPSPVTVDALGLAVLAIAHAPSDMPPTEHKRVQLAGKAAFAFYGDRGDKGAALFQALEKEFPNRPGVHYVVGISEVPEDPNAAMAEFRKEIAINPVHVPARQQIAILEIKSGDAATALQEAQEALKLAPNDPLNHAIVGRACEHLGQLSKAVAEYETAVRLDPVNAELRLSLSQALRHLGQTAQAEKQLAEFRRLKSARDAGSEQ